MKRLKIGICDDDRSVALELKERIEVCLTRIHTNADIFVYFSGKELLKEVSMLDTVFLDLGMPDMDGIDVGEQIIRKNMECEIIIETGMHYRYKEAFRINARRFITKSFQEKEIEEAVQCIYNLKIGMEMISLYKNRIRYNVKQRDIEYIEAYDGYAEIYLNKRCFRKDISLNNLEKILDNQIFIRVTSKYIINLLQVDRYECGNFYIGDKEIKASRRKRKISEKRYIEFKLTK